MTSFKALLPTIAKPDTEITYLAAFGLGTQLSPFLGAHVLVDQAGDPVTVASGALSVQIANSPADPATDTQLTALLAELQKKADRTEAQTVSGSVSVSNQLTGFATASGLNAVVQAIEALKDGAGNQPVSVATLPLPAGAATAADLGALLAELEKKADRTQTQPISGAVTVSNFPVSQPVSGSVSVSNQIAGFATASGQTSLETAIAALTKPTDTQQVVGAVAVSNFPASQPISGSVTVANPLTGFATASGQTSLETAIAALTKPADAQQVAGTVAVSNFPASQPVSGSVSVSNQLTGFATDTKLEEVRAAIAAQASGGTLVLSVFKATQAGTGYAQGDIIVLRQTPPASPEYYNASADAVITPDTADLGNVGSSSAVTVSNFPASQPVSGSVSVSNQLTGFATASGQTSLETAIAALTKPADTQQVVGAVAVSNFPASQPISGSVTVANPLTGFATASGQTSLETAIAALTKPADTQQVAASALPLPAGAATATAQATANTTLSTIAGKLPSTLGQKTSANSLAVALASDQGALSITGSVSVSNQLTGFATASGQASALTAISALTKPADTQQVAGAVTVSNFPASQPVSGSVSVSNQLTGFATASGQTSLETAIAALTTPTDTQPISGSVTVANPLTGFATASGQASALTALQALTKPADTQQVAGAVTVSNFPASQPVSGSVSISNQIAGFATASGQTSLETAIAALTKPADTQQVAVAQPANQAQGLVTVTTAGASVALGAGSVKTGVYIQWHPDNTGRVYFGAAGVGNALSAPYVDTEVRTAFVQVDDLSALHINADNPGDKALYHAS